mgnify:CR=1 FL=1
MEPSFSISEQRTALLGFWILRLESRSTGISSLWFTWDSVAESQSLLRERSVEYHWREFCSSIPSGIPEK